MSVLRAEIFDQPVRDRSKYASSPHSLQNTNDTTSASLHVVSVQTPSDAFVSYSKLVKCYGFHYFLLGRMTPEKRLDLAVNGCINDIPSYTFDELVQQDVVHNWSVADTLVYSSAPFWVSNTPSTSRTPNPVSNSKTLPLIDQFLFDKLEISETLCLPLNSLGSDRPFLCFFSNSPNVSPGDEVVLFYKAQRIFEKLQNISNRRNLDTASPLTKRQLECLSWASRGKTSSEISSIVSLSEHTVNHYLASCCHILDCVNRTQAVAQALRLNLIE